MCSITGWQTLFFALKTMQTVCLNVLKISLNAIHNKATFSLADIRAIERYFKAYPFSNFSR